MVDLSKYHTKFFAESNVNLADLTASVDAIKTLNASKIQIEDGFRAAHSIKGAAGIFGFDRVTALATETEAVLYAVMTGTVMVTPTIADALVEARGILADLLKAVESKIEASPGIENEIIARLSKLYPNG